MSEGRRDSMTIFLSFLVFFSLLATAIAATLIVPSYAAWPQSLVALVAFSLLAAFVVLLMLLNRRHVDKRLAGLERSIDRLARESDRLALRVTSVDRNSDQDDEKSGDMIREMRVLQTLLGQIIGRSGVGLRKGDINIDAVLKGAAVTKAARDTLPPEIEADILTVVQGALSENRVDLYLQPTVALPSRRPQYYECFSRVRGEHDEVIYPQQYLPVAESSGLIGTLDNLLLFRCIQLVRKLGPRRPNVKFFCNISSASVLDEDFFPQFIDYMASNTELAERLVFEFPQADLQALDRKTRNRLIALGDRGYAFCMDHVTSVRLDPSELKSWNIRFVKIDADLLLGDKIDIHPADIRRSLKKQGIDLIAARVEDENQVPELLDLDVSFAQGYVFGKPRLNREDAGTEDE
ncbi:hypothetical protein JCM17846_27060 [Iodidimonas nitroreducens]|uniref:EAL domain-containing protein n=2 Tax=Iodidimonas nitroreducens TaxID=1236968 RepID=A0A5A7NBC9_9PROT|nr:hypothetical protein JCM17846_27060 [Iodidimonas nitroreducens]